MSGYYKESLICENGHRISYSHNPGETFEPYCSKCGSTLAIIPRAIRAALYPMEKWVLEREFNIKETEKLLSLKLENIDVDRIESPESYVAVPALNYLSYSTDSNELRSMYANLLANSMLKDKKKYVHPSYSEIIKQLSPDEAKLFEYIYKGTVSLPFMRIRYTEKDSIYGSDYIPIYLILPEIGLELKNNQDVIIYLSNLKRLDLININYDRFLKEEKYKDLIEECNKLFSEPPESFSKMNLTEYKPEKGVIELTEYGISFGRVVIDNIK